MRPKIKKTEFINADDEWLIQLVGQTVDKEEKLDLTNNEKELLSKRIQLCNLITQIEFTLESYGVINFFIEYKQDIMALVNLKELLVEFNESYAIETIEKTLNFYNEKKSEFDYLRNNPKDYSERREKLQDKYFNLEKPRKGIYYHIDLSQSIKNIAQKIRENPNEFCVDENGNELL